jgi:hypothetical protein
MKINSERIEVGPNEFIDFKDIKTMRLLNDKLALILRSGRVVEISRLRPSTIDLVFRTYENYLKDHGRIG